MAKKTIRKEPPPPLPPPVKAGKPFSITDFRMQALLLTILGFLFYANSFNNEYAFDDGIVIQHNDYVQEGFSGIGKILTRDAYDSFYRQRHAAQQFSGGRYRPLSAVTFAVEQQLFGSKAKDKPDTDIAYIRHVVNVVLYIFSVLVLLYFLHFYVFKKNPLAAFIASLLFLIHPLHTEVVANVKSRDEILSFLLIILTFILVLRYRESKKKIQLFLGCLFYFLALLAKEYAVSLIVLIPMLVYIVKRASVKDSLLSVLPFLLVAAVYIGMRLSFVGMGGTPGETDLLNDPYKFATATQKLATKIEVLLIYIKQLLYPSTLSYDYSYNTIPYVNFGNGLVWLSMLIYLSMIGAGIYLLTKRNIIAFAIAFYLAHIFLVSNFMLDIGATMGDRLVYHSSFGFVIVLAILITMAAGKIKTPSAKNAALIITGCLVVFWCGAKVIPRNAEWKNDTILYLADAKKVPNSALANGNAGMSYYNLSIKPENKDREKELTEKAIEDLNKAVTIHNRYVNGYLNLAVVYMRLKDYDKSRYYLDIVKELYPNNPLLKANCTALAANYYNEAMTSWEKDTAKAFRMVNAAVELVPDNTDYWYNLGGMYYTAHNYEKARLGFTKALEIDPNNKLAKEGVAALPQAPVK